MNSQNDVFSFNKYNDALLAGLISSDGTIFGNVSAAWLSGGNNSGAISLVQKVIFATDTNTASLRGSLNTPAYSLAGT